MKIAHSVEKSLEGGYIYAVQNGHEFLTTEHFLLGAIKQVEVQQMLHSFKVNSEELLVALENFMGENVPVAITTTPPITPTLDRILQSSMQMAQSQSQETATMWMVLLSILKEEDTFSNYLLKKSGIDALAVKRYASHGIGSQQTSSTVAGEEDQGQTQENALAKFGINLNARAKESKIDVLIGREYEIHRTAQILSRRRKNNPLLVGEPGVGKTAIAEGLAKMIADGQAPDALKDKEIWSLNMGAMLAGTKYRGDFEQRIKNVLDEAQQNPNVILFIDEIHTVIGAGSSGNGTMDASNIIKPALASGELRVIGATTFDEYREIFQKEKALDRRFQKVDVVEPTPSETVAILKGLKGSLEKHHGVKYTQNALDAAVELSVKYMTDRFLPDKAIDLLDEAGACERLKPEKKRHNFIDKVLIEETVSRVTRIPVTQVSSTERDSLSNLNDDLKSAVFGQEKAIDTLSSAVVVAKAGLNDERKPLGSFLFTGPTGVGKTEVVRQLSNTLGVPLVRFDMSEYMEAHSVARLIGSPPGYVGHEKGGLLTDAIFKNPHCILLLDEIEKAHPDIYNILLQVFDDGSLTDGNGRKVNFKNTIIVMTSNSGAQAAAKSSIGFLKADQSSEARKVLDMTFAPEFRNRLDAIVTFDALGPKEISKIVDKNVRELERKLAEKNVTIEVSQAVRDDLAQRGYDPAMGARPMARLFQNDLKKPLAEKILFGDLENGGHVFLDKKDSEWVWNIEPLQAQVKATQKTTKKVTKKKDDNPPSETRRPAMV